jgi:hypothetical protein
MKNTKVLIGQKGWLFLTHDTNDIINQIKGNKSLNSEAWSQLINKRLLFFEKSNIPYYFIIAPNKECVYSQFLPNDIEISQNRPIYDLIKLYDKLIYPIEEIKAANSFDTYDKMDTHWNDYGAYVAYHQLIDRILLSQKIFKIDQKDINFNKTPKIDPDLGSKIGLNKDTTIKCKVSLNDKIQKIYDNNIKNTGRHYVWQNTSIPTDLKIMFFGDSFGHKLANILKYSCKTLIYKQQPNLDFDFILEQKPDMVISEQVERFIIRTPES